MSEAFFFDLKHEVAGYDCPIQGTIPEWLSGTLLRNGPACFSAEGKRVKSWFDGLAMIHAFSFSRSHVSYSNRFIRSEQYHLMTVEKSMDFWGFAQDPCGKAFKNQSSRFFPAEVKEVGNAVVNIAKYADLMVALTEYPLPVVFDAHSLKTLGNFSYSDSLPKEQIFESAHPQHDSETVNYLVRFGRKSTYVIWKLEETARQIIAEIPVDLPAYMHSFALTEKYVVLVEYPFVVNPIDLIQMQKPFIMNFKWQPERGTHFIVVDRSSGEQVAKIKTDPFFAFHHANAYDAEGKIVIDVVIYSNASVIGEVAGLQEADAASTHPQLHRFVLSLQDQTVSQEKILSDPVEMPRVPASKVARPYQYCYAVDYNLPTSKREARPLYKIDVKKKTRQTWSEPGCFPGEPIFVPHPQAKSEDEGVILSLVLDFVQHRSFLLVLDAKSFTEVARAAAPHAIPVGLHGMWND